MLFWSWWLGLKMSVVTMWPAYTLETPNIDIVARGAYSSGRGIHLHLLVLPRGTIISGRHPAVLQRRMSWEKPAYALKNGSSCNGPLVQWSIEVEEVTIAEALVDGYVSGHTGKWHMASLQCISQPKIKGLTSPEPLGIEWQCVHID